MEFVLYIVCVFSAGVFVASEEDIESVSVTEGESVTLNFTETLNSDLQIMWTFKDHTSKTRIAEIFQQKVLVNDEAGTERFRGRVNVDLQTGSLTINHINKSHAGLYKVQMFHGTVKHKTFRVSVHAVLAEPVIIRDSSPCSSSRCLLWCSAVNVSDATLSWFIGSSEISSIHLNAENLNWSLPLTVEHEDGNIYSCVVNNSISSRKTLISRSSDLCQCRTPIPESSTYLLRIVLSVLLCLLILILSVYVWVFIQNKHYSNK